MILKKVIIFFTLIFLFNTQSYTAENKIILKINNFILKKEYNNKYKLILTEINEKLNIYDNFLSSKIENYKNIIIDNEINLTTNHRIEKYSEGKNKDIYLNIHYVKKSGFLNIPKISIL